jgi:hypothetical protein
MGWLERFGKKTPDGSGETEQSKAEADAFFERLGQTIDERLSAKVEPLSQTVTALKTDFDAIKAEASRPPARTNADGSPYTPSDDEKRESIQAATVALAVETKALLTERDAIDGMPAAWKYLAPAVRQMFANTPTQRKAQTDYREYCDNCVTLIIGNAAKKAGLSTRDNGATFFLEDKGGSGSSEEGGVLSDPSLVWRDQKADGTVRVVPPHDTLRKLGIDPKAFEESAKNGVV